MLSSRIAALLRRRNRLDRRVLADLARATGGLPRPHAGALILPTATLVLGWMPLTARMVRVGVVGALNSDYAQMARLKGLSEQGVIRSHVLPNSLVPAIQAFALTAAGMPAGIVIVEYLFAYQGIGVFVIDAVRARDLATVEAISLILVAFYIVANLLSDIATTLLTPRLRTAELG